MQKALSIREIDAAVDKFSPVTPSHPYYVDFKNLRGDFQERRVMKMLNVEFDLENDQYTFDFRPNQTNKQLLFLAGMRGSGKTSELAKYANLLDFPRCFFVVICNIDEELDMDNVEYMDVLIFQLEKLLEKAESVNLKISDSVIESMEVWFQDRVKEINRSLEVSGGAGIELGGESGLSFAGILGKLLGVTASLKAGLSGSYERAETIRTSLKNRFVDFAVKFNTFIEQTNAQLRTEGKGQEILFIVDGLEKTMSADTRRKIIMEESNRIRQIKANTIFTLPIELMKEGQRIGQFGEVITFPFIKIKNRDGSIVKNAVDKFEEFIYKRIDRKLFDTEKTVKLAIEYCGGSPRQLLRILERSAWETEAGKELITYSNMKAAIDQLGNAAAKYLQPEEWARLKTLKTDLDKGNPIGFGNDIQSLLEKIIIFEYNDGTYKRVNPLLEVSKLYKHNVLNEY
ncbi:MAG: hypothetical protein AB8F95_11860 [Bacteroidia bacterium]